MIIMLIHLAAGSYLCHRILRLGANATSWERGFAVGSPSILETAWGLCAGFAGISTEGYL